MASREEIRQVILNLISNAEHAVKAVERPGIIRLKTRSEEGFAVVEVSDNGSGIPSEMAGRVFEPFFTTKVVGQGTGLGLSISLGIAEAHGGALTLSAADRGASFVLKLPIASEQNRPIVTGRAGRPTVPLLPEKAGGLVN